MKKLGDNPVTVFGAASGITLCDHKRRTRAIALIDTEDIEKVRNARWALRCLKGKPCVVIDLDGRRLHRVIMGVSDKFEGASNVVDHINRDILDNRKSNLRITTIAINTRNQGIHPRNTSGYRGVVFYKRYKKWYAKLQCKGICHSTGLFKTKEEAYQARKKLEAKYWNKDDLVVPSEERTEIRRRYE